MILSVGGRGGLASLRSVEQGTGDASDTLVCPPLWVLYCNNAFRTAVIFRVANLLLVGKKRGIVHPASHKQSTSPPWQWWRKQYVWQPENRTVPFGLIFAGFHRIVQSVCTRRLGCVRTLPSTVLCASVCTVRVHDCRDPDFRSLRCRVSSEKRSLSLSHPLSPVPIVYFVSPPWIPGSVTTWIAFT